MGVIAGILAAVVIFVGGVFFGNWNPAQNFLKKHFGD